MFSVKRSSKIGSLKSNQTNVEPHPDISSVHIGQSSQEEIIQNAQVSNFVQTHSDLESLPKDLSQEMFFRVEENRFGQGGFTTHSLELAKEQEWMNQESILKKTEELSASITAINTNLVIILLGIVTSSYVKYIVVDYQSIFNLTSNSLHKSILPITTTVVNFGLIRKVGVKFWIWACSR